MKYMQLRIITLVTIVLFCFSLTACEDTRIIEYSYYETDETDSTTSISRVDSENSSYIETDDAVEDIPYESFHIPGNKPENYETNIPANSTITTPPYYSWNFYGKKITIMREWDPYPNGKNAAWDNFNSWVAKCEKHYNVDIVEKKWKATLETEMLAGVKPEGHVYLLDPTGGNVYDLAKKVILHILMMP